MSKQDTTLDDIGQSIIDLGSMIDVRFQGVEEVQKEQGVLLKKQGVLLEDMTHKFDKNIDLLTKQMNVKKQVNGHEDRLNVLETGQELLKSTVRLHAQQLRAK